MKSEGQAVRPCSDCHPKLDFCTQIDFSLDRCEKSGQKKIPHEIWFLQIRSKPHGEVIGLLQMLLQSGHSGCSNCISECLFTHNMTHNDRLHSDRDGHAPDDNNKNNNNNNNFKRHCDCCHYVRHWHGRQQQSVDRCRDVLSAGTVRGVIGRGKAGRKLQKRDNLSRNNMSERGFRRSGLQC